MMSYGAYKLKMGNFDLWINFDLEGQGQSSRKALGVFQIW